MGQRNPWTCDCCPDGENAICDTEHGYAISVAVINASGEELTDERLAAIPTLFSLLFKGKGRTELCTHCAARDLAMLLLRPTNSALSCDEVKALLDPVVAAIAEAGTVTVVT